MTLPTSYEILAFVSRLIHEIEYAKKHNLAPASVGWHQARERHLNAFYEVERFITPLQKTGEIMLKKEGK